MVDNHPKPITLKQYLKNASKDELINDIAELCKKFPSVRDYYQIKLSPDAELLVNAKYRKAIEDEFFPARGFGKARLAVAKKAISEFKKVSQTPESIIDIMIFYVEQGVKFTKAYGDIDEAFYISMETMYEKAIDLINKHKLHDTFRKRCRKIVIDTTNMGWGFHDQLKDIYNCGGFENI